MSTSQVSGLVLAGGQSRRMGQDKALMIVDGEPLALRAARLLAQFCSEVIVASGDGQRLGSLGLAQVADSPAGMGPLSGMVAGLEVAAHPLVAVLAVDMPGANLAIFRLLCELWDGRDGVVPEVEGQIEPLHAVYPRRAAPLLRSCIAGGRLSVRQAVASMDVRLVDRSVWGHLDASGAFAHNLNVPADLVR